MLSPVARHLLHHLPVPLALRLVRALSNRTRRPSVLPEQAAAIAQARRFDYAPGRVAWSWGEGPLVVLVHGWNGRAAQLAPLGLRLAASGFRSVALDVGGHGESAGKRTRWQMFGKDLARVIAAAGQEAFALVGHSAGGLAMMAARRRGELEAQRYVCICAPSHPFPPIDALRHRLAPPDAVIVAMRGYLASELGTEWSALTAGWAYAGAAAELLLCYDTGDRLIPDAEGERIREWCPSASLHRSSGNGHLKVLSAEDLHRTVSDFLVSARAPAAPV